VKRTFILILILYVAMPFMAQEDYTPITIERNNNYSLDLFKSVSNNKENTVISPFCISSCMAMAYIGSNGKTLENIQNKMNFITPIGVLSSYKNLIKKYEILNNEDVNILIGNALWIGHKKDVQKKYKNLLQMNFDTYVSQIDFNDSGENGIKQVNRWAKKSSNFNFLSLIDQEEIDETDELVFTNYMFFKGTWENPFNDQLTNKEDFFLNNGNKKKVDFMKQTVYLKYNENDIFQIIELPYSGKNLSLIVMLPKKENLIDSLESILNPSNYSFWTNELYTKLISLSLPKFRIETSHRISQYHNDLGLEAAFSENPDYQRISIQPIKLSKIIQKTIIQVDENNNSAFTEVIDKQNSENTEEDDSYITFNADHPFIFILKDNLNNNILLMGRINDPFFNDLSSEYHN
jgi:serpin B